MRLLNRTTRRLSLTESGQAFYERCVQLLADLDEAEEAVTASAVVPRGTLRLTASISFGVGYLAPAIAEFQQQHPQLRFDIELSDRAVDLVDEGIDLAIRIGDIGSQALIGRTDRRRADDLLRVARRISHAPARRARPPTSPVMRA